MWHRCGSTSAISIYVCFTDFLPSPMEFEDLEYKMKGIGKYQLDYYFVVTGSQLCSHHTLYTTLEERHGLLSMYVSCKVSFNSWFERILFRGNFFTDLLPNWYKKVSFFFKWLSLLFSISTFNKNEIIDVGCSIYYQLFICSSDHIIWHKYDTMILVRLEEEVAERTRDLETTKQQVEKTEQQVVESRHKNLSLREENKRKDKIIQQLMQRIREQKENPDSEHQRLLQENNLLKEENWGLWAKIQHTICSVCWDEGVQVSFLPCGHKVACMGCVDTLPEGKCPMCRENIQDTKSV